MEITVHSFNSKIDIPITEPPTKQHQPDPVKVEVQVFKASSATAKIKYGNSQEMVVTSVYGPQETKTGQRDYEKLTIELHGSSLSEHQKKEYTDILYEAIKGSNYPKCTLKLIIDTLLTGGDSVYWKSVILNSMFFALNQGGIDLQVNPMALSISHNPINNELTFDSTDTSPDRTNVALVIDTHDPSTMIHMDPQGQGFDI